ncbi:MAG TPA: hypothetical protein VLM85_19070 [Polyangiaceae bacterium]|nr:hypothetical protein [Polyangiaceae bacterium]
MESDGDARPSIVGRWSACGADAFSTTAHAGIEFGGNGRWRFLTNGANGLTPLPLTNDNAGRYAALATGQLNIRHDGPGNLTTVFVTYGAGMDALRVTTEGSAQFYYARTIPSPNNGDDNIPSLVDGSCSLVGTWNVPAETLSSGAPAATFSFDALGNFVGGPLGSDLCSAHTMYGRYSLSPTQFLIAENVGMGLCAWWFDGGWGATFDASCSTVTLTEQFDDCTGGRGYFQGGATLTRQP